MAEVVNIAWIVLIWTQIMLSNIELYHLNALKLHVPPGVLRKQGSRWNDDDRIAPTSASQSVTADTSRKYRQLDVDEEWTRNRGGVRKQFLPLKWFDRRFVPYHIKSDSEQAVRNDANQREEHPTIPFRRPCANSNESATSGSPVLESKRKRHRKHQYVVSNVHELREKVLDEGLHLQHVKIECPYNSANATIDEVLQHDVIQLMVSRFHSQSKPGFRHPSDTAYLALAIEGGGVRGAVCSGMAAAIATLGLTDSFDTIVGSSAGSVIGAYMVSRQMCVDVYLDILPAAKSLFACLKRLMHSISVTALDVAFSPIFHRQPNLRKSLFPKGHPGMNISFILDGIMNDKLGLRPLDWESFRRNDQRQPLRVASSYSKNGKLHTKCFGTDHFFSDYNHSKDYFVRCVDGRREGLYACLEASMTVPGATGDPVFLVDNGASSNDGEKGVAFFDAFCFEPLPYRSAVEDGATHVLVLCSRPEGFQPKTIPGLYERGVANMYFKAHGEPEVAEFFERGGQQYIYAEDLLTLEEGKLAGIENGGRVHVPPPMVLYGVDRDEIVERQVRHREKWRKAHLLPLKVPIGTKELPSLEQDRDAVGDAVRGGFAAAFDILAPAIGLQLEHNLTGIDVANLLFPPDGSIDDFVLEHQLHVKGDFIPSGLASDPDANEKLDRIEKRPPLKPQHEVFPLFGDIQRFQRNQEGRNRESRAEHLLQVLPGFASGRMAHLAIGLKTRIA